MRRFHIFLVAVSIALQAIDGVVGALGHSHGEAPTASAAVDCGHHGSACSHHDDHAATNQAEQRPANSEPDPHDDCSLCRHVSQPVVPVVVAVEVVRSQCIEPFVPAVVERIIATVAIAHAARGPPVLCA